jgi:orotate phosphoribosyltransferase
MRLIIESGGIEVRNVDGGEEAFLYSTGNYGPGYVDIKGRVGWNEVFSSMVDLLADKLVMDNIVFDLIVGMMTGGALPGFRLKEIMIERLNKDITYIYQRGARKVGGHQELDTGDRKNPNIKSGCRTLVVEELVNFAGTTTTGVLYERKKGRTVEDAATILFYENPVAIEKLVKHNINLHYAIGLRSDLLPFAVKEGFFTEKQVEGYCEFIDDPRKWNESRGYKFHGGDE